MTNKRIENTTAYFQSNNIKIPAGFSYNGGTCSISASKSDDNVIDMCDALFVIAMTRDLESSSWGKHLIWWDADGVEHSWAMPNELLSGDGQDIRKHLLANGLKIHSGGSVKNALHNYIMTCEPEDRAVSVDKSGWHGDQYIMMDGQSYGAGKEKVLLQVGSALTKLEMKGTLKEWNESIGKYAVNNPILCLSICAALAGPLLHFVGEESGGFHLAGGSSSGKTTALKVAASVWGMQPRSWRTTDNAAESWARFANDGFLPIDELSQVDGRAADHLAYMLGNGQTKARANKFGIANKAYSFRLIFLSTGEIGISDKMAETGKQAKAGQILRMLEIQADAGYEMGIFENIYDFNKPDELAIHLSKSSKKYTGTVAHSFIQWLVSLPFQSLSEDISLKRKNWIERHVPQNANGQVIRAANRFSLLAIAGEYAAASKIIDWPIGTAHKSAAVCFDNWMKNRGGLELQEVTEGLKSILNFINVNGASRFSDFSSDKKTILNRAGYFKHNSLGQPEYYIFPDIMHSEIFAGSKNSLAIKKAAVDSKLIQTDKEGKHTVNIKLPDLGQKRMYLITPDSYNKR